MCKETLHKLISRHEIVKADKGDGILHAWVMGIKGDDVLHSHGCQLFKPHGAVQGFALAALVLTAFV